MKKFLLFVCLFISSIILGQNAKIDSLLNLLKTAKSDTNKVKNLNKLCWEYILIGEYNKGLLYSKQGLGLSTSLNFKKGIAQSYNNLGNIYKEQGNYQEALKNHFASLKIKEEMNDKYGISVSYNNIGIVYDNLGNYPEALNNHFASLKIKEEIKDKKGIATSYGNIGVIYMRQGNFKRALKSYFSSLKIREEIKDKQGIAVSYNNIGSIYEDMGNYPEAFKNYLAGLKIFLEIEYKKGIANSYQGIGNVYCYQGDSAYSVNNKIVSQEKYSNAFKNYAASLKIREEIGDKDGSIQSYINIGNLFAKINKAKEAERYLNKALKLSVAIGSKDDVKETYAGLVVLDSTIGDFKAAFEDKKMFIIYRDSLYNEETQRKSMQSIMQYEYDKKEIAAKAEQEKHNAIANEEKQKQKVIIYSVGAVLLLVIIFSLFLFNRFRITSQQKKVIETQMVLVDKAYETLHEKNKEVMASINYASRIQKALIPSDKNIATQLNRLMKK